jgi:TRL (tRNA-associated locus)-like protein
MAMNKLARRLTFAVLSASFLTGCAAIGHAPVTGLITLEEKGPVAMGTAAGSSKVGRAEAWGILVFATGDASIRTAMRNGGITRVHHVDHETTSWFGVYSTYTTIVYGE